jgi:hypothetical protein
MNNITLADYVIEILIVQSGREIADQVYKDINHQGSGILFYAVNSSKDKIVEQNPKAMPLHMAFKWMDNVFYQEDIDLVFVKIVEEKLGDQSCKSKIKTYRECMQDLDPFYLGNGDFNGERIELDKYFPQRQENTLFNPKISKTQNMEILEDVYQVFSQAQQKVPNLTSLSKEGNNSFLSKLRPKLKKSIEDLHIKTLWQIINTKKDK